MSIRTAVQTVSGTMDDATMTLLDDLVARGGEIDPDLVGVNQAAAGDKDWLRDRGESERDFLDRVKREAADVGFKLVHIYGQLQVGSDPVESHRS